MTKITEENLEKTAKRLGIAAEQIPRNIAIIMDGNGRWAQEKGLPRYEGHRQGGRVVEKIAVDGVELGFESMTLYTFSTENWKRPKVEVDGLMNLYTEYLVGIRPLMMKHKVRLVHLGQVDDLPAELLKELGESIEMTADNEGMMLGLALNYSGRSEIIEATKKIAKEYKDGQIGIEDIDETFISQHMYNTEICELDLLIRTANEMRVSNFLLWQIAYSEFYVTGTYWPDFSRVDLEEAILAYSKRSRRFGDIAQK